ncbi:hypothetical protein [Robertkochia flava]|uniref:hypothetical protein n=1 Tax=Robertkochia flava TaxID=3447986 RepID=UPI001CCDF184|nr:hypothetical protein [Robertkochia marina]
MSPFLRPSNFVVMYKRNLTHIVLAGFVVYGLLSGIILYSYHTQTEALIEEQQKLANSNKNLSEKYDNLVQVVNGYKRELESRKDSIQ